jgi:hypothetical protein
MQAGRNDAALRVAGQRRRGAVKGFENVFERVGNLGGEGLPLSSTRWRGFTPPLLREDPQRPCRIFRSRS